MNFVTIASFHGNDQY